MKTSGRSVKRSSFALLLSSSARPLLFVDLNLSCPLVIYESLPAFCSPPGQLMCSFFRLFPPKLCTGRSAVVLNFARLRARPLPPFTFFSLGLPLKPGPVVLPSPPAPVPIKKAPCPPTTIFDSGAGCLSFFESTEESQPLSPLNFYLAISAQLDSLSCREVSVPTARLTSQFLFSPPTFSHGNASAQYCFSITFCQLSFFCIRPHPLRPCSGSIYLLKRLAFGFNSIANVRSSKLSPRSTDVPSFSTALQPTHYCHMRRPPSCVLLYCVAYGPPLG